MWRTLKLQRTVCARDLAALASTSDLLVTEEIAQRYLTVLMRGRYLRVVKPSSIFKTPTGYGRTQAIYRLIDWTGPMPPTERRVTVVWDENRRAYAHLPQGGDA